MPEKDAELDPYYISILSYIRNNQPVHPKVLAKEYGVTRQAIDHRLKILEEYGYVKKIWKNGKVYYVLTDSGLEKLNDFLDIKYKALPFGIIVMLALFIIGLGGFMYNFIIGNIYGGILSLVFWVIAGVIIYVLVKSR